MPRAVRFEQYGGIEVLQVVDVPHVDPPEGEVLVTVKAAGINPGEARIREGELHARWPATFPSGQGSDLAGVVAAIGDNVTTVKPGDEVFGWTDRRAAQAEEVLTPERQLIPKPASVPWEVAGSLYVAGATAWAATQAIGVDEHTTVVVTAAAGGVGSIAVQLARIAGARVIGIASEANHDWLQAHGVEPIAYGEGLEDRLRAAGPIDAFFDAYGGYLDLALALGVKPDRIDAIAEFEKAQKLGVKLDGNAVGARPEVLKQLADLVAAGRLDVPIAATYPLERVRDAYAELERRHTRGKIVLLP